MSGIQVKPEVGRFGLGLAGMGIVGAAASLWVAPPVAPLALLAGAMLYLIGAFLAVAAFGYQRGTKLFLALRVMRLAFAVIVIFAILRVAGAV